MAGEKTCPRAIFEERVSKLVPLVSFMSRRQILQYMSKNMDMRITTRQKDRYIKSARERVLESLKEKQKTAMEDIVNNMNNLYLKALEFDDLKTAVSIQEKMMKLLGVDKLLEQDQHETLYEDTEFVD